MPVGDADECPAERRLELALAVDLGGEPEVLRAVERLADAAHAPAVQRELPDGGDGFVPGVAGAEADGLVQREVVAARADDGRAPTSLGAPGEEPVERVDERR